MNHHKKSTVLISFFSYNKFSPVVRFLTLSDVLMNFGFGLIAPIFAIYIEESIKGATLETIGIASTIYFVSKSLMQVPIGVAIDRWKGEKDDYLFLLAGMFIYCLIPLLYIFIHDIWALYLIQFVYGMAGAAAYPAWMAIFTRHVDSKHEGVEWSVYATLVEFGMAMSATIGGFVAFRFGYNALFVLASILVFLSNLFVYLVFNQIRKK